MGLLLTFCILNVLNVILQTATHICTIKYGKWESATINAIAFGVYAIVIVYMVCDLPLPIKVIIVAATNFVGVLAVKTLEECISKKKFWKIEVVCKNEDLDLVINTCEQNNIMYITTDISCNTIATLFCTTEQKNNALKVMDREKIVYFLTESTKTVEKNQDACEFQESMVQ